MKHTIRIHFVDFYNSFDPRNNFILDQLNNDYNVAFDEKNPDYLFCSCFGKRHFQYKDSIKIFFSGENLTCDYNLYDYSIDSDYLEFSDRHLRYPIHLIYNCNEERPLITQENALNRKFCNFVYSNSIYASPERYEIFQRLSEYKKIDSGGRYLNNIGGPVADKMEFIANYKFTIAYENSSKPGYTTEKLLDPLFANSVPIYWGDPLAAKDFNPKAFINAFDFRSIDNLIDEIKRLDSDDDAYWTMINEPIYNGSQDYKQNKNNELRKFLSYIINQDKNDARRSTTYGNTRGLMRDHYYLMKSETDIIPKYLKKILFFYYRHFKDADYWKF